jgi:hypothetical protein
MFVKPPKGTSLDQPCQLVCYMYVSTAWFEMSLCPREKETMPVNKCSNYKAPSCVAVAFINTGCASQRRLLVQTVLYLKPSRRCDWKKMKHIVLCLMMSSPYVGAKTAHDREFTTARASDKVFFCCQQCYHGYRTLTEATIGPLRHANRKMMHIDII